MQGVQDGQASVAHIDLPQILETKAHIVMSSHWQKMNFKRYESCIVMLHDAPQSHMKGVERLWLRS